MTGTTLIRRAATHVLRAPIFVYRAAISPLIGPVCRYQPTCSAYALEALELHGAARGTWLAVRRVSRCHPWHEGGLDPVPEPNVRSQRRPTSALPVKAPHV